MTSRGPFQLELFPDSTNPLPSGEWPLSPVLHFLFLQQLSTQKPTSRPILWQLSFFTKFNKIYKKLLKGFLKMQEDYYVHTTPFIGILTALPPNASDAGLHWSLSNTFPTDYVHPRVPWSHSLSQTVSSHQEWQPVPLLQHSRHPAKAVFEHTGRLQWHLQWYTDPRPSSVVSYWSFWGTSP